MKFFSDISLWWLVPWLGLSIAGAFWYYRNQKEITYLSSWKKRLLTGLRALTIFVLGLLLAGILIENKDYKTDPPVFITLVDNSASMLNYKDSNEVKSRIDDFQKKLEEQYGERFQTINYTIGKEISDSVPQYNEHLSDLNAGFEFIYEKYYNRNIGGICFISDGNYNEGQSPVFTAEKINLTPVFSVGVGDTLIKRDQLIRNVSVNDVVFYKNQFPVEIDLEGRKIGKNGSEVSIYKNGQKIASEKVNYDNPKLSFQHLSFVLEATEIGFINYTVKVSPLDDEISYKNNERSFYVEVIDSRTKVLIVAKAPHPDISAVKQMIEKDENIEVESILFSEWDGSLKNTELLIWHEPGVNGSQKMIKEIEDKKIPVLYIIGSQSNAGNLGGIGLPVTIPGGNRFDETQSYVNQSFQLFELSDELKSSMNSWPPLVVHFGGSEEIVPNTLLGQRIGNVQKKNPILYFGSKSGRKFGVLHGEGLWKWKITEYNKTQDFKSFRELIEKTVQYLVVKQNTEALRIQLPNKFTINDEILINAEFYNASMQQITTPDIDLYLENEKGKDFKYRFAKGALDYNLSLGKLKSGQYKWKASAKHNGKAYTKSGVFVVEDVSLEDLSTHSDFNLMRQIAKRTNGEFYKLNQLNKLLDDISNRDDIATISYEEASFLDLIDWWVLLLILILSLSVEWFIRRYSGTY